MRIGCGKKVDMQLEQMHPRSWNINRLCPIEKGTSCVFSRLSDVCPKSSLARLERLEGRELEAQRDRPLQQREWVSTACILRGELTVIEQRHGQQRGQPYETWSTI